jgi:hypothetical protein
MDSRILVALLVTVFASGCATRPSHPDAFAFGVMGDTPYTAAEEPVFLAMMARMDAEDLAFVVHVGDIAGGGACADELYAKRRAQFDASAHPLVYTPGDNEWTDCRGVKRDPLERLAKLRQVFFPDRFSLGRKRLELFVQEGCVREGVTPCECPALPENRFWTRGGVRFVTLHVVGSNNNVGFDPDNDREARCREEANAAWLEYVLRASLRSQTRGLVIFVHANPLEGKNEVYRGLVEHVRDAARRLKRPVLFVHGDTHVYRIDTPVKDSLGNPVIDITRLEVYGSPFVGWARVTVDPDDPLVFSIRPHLQGVAR